MSDTSNFCYVQVAEWIMNIRFFVLLIKYALPPKNIIPAPDNTSVTIKGRELFFSPVEGEPFCPDGSSGSSE